MVCAHGIVRTIFSGHLNIRGLFVCGKKDRAGAEEVERRRDGECVKKRTKEIDKIKMKR